MRTRAEGRAGRALPRLRGSLAPALLAAALLGPPGPALAQDPVHAPCLAPHPDLAGYQAAFEAAGWTVATGEARDEALRGPSEQLRALTTLPPVAQTLEELEEQLASAHEWGRGAFAQALVLTRGDMAVTVEILPSGSGHLVRCVLTAPKLQDVRRILLAAEPPEGRFRTHTIRVLYPHPLPGTADLRIDVTRATRDVPLPEPPPGTEAVVVTYSVGAPE